MVKVIEAKVKVKYKGYISQKMAVSGAFVSHLVFFSDISYAVRLDTYYCLVSNERLTIHSTDIIAFLQPIHHQTLKK